MAALTLLSLLWAGEGLTADKSLSSPSSLRADRVAVVDVTEVIAQSKAWEAVQKKFTQIIYTDRSYVATEEKRLLEEEQKLKEQWEFVTQEKSSQKEKEKRFKSILETKDAHDKALSALQERVQRRKTQLDNAFNMARSEIHQRIQEIIDGIRTQEKLSLIFLSPNLVFFDPSYDITSRVADRLNAVLKFLPFEVDGTDVFWKKPLHKDS